MGRLWASGLSLRETAKRLGIHHQTAIDDLARLYQVDYSGAYLRRLQRRRVPTRDQRMATAVKLRGTGLSLRAVAAELGVSYQTIANDLARWQREYGHIVIPLSRSGARSCPPRGQN